MKNIAVIIPSNRHYPPIFTSMDLLTNENDIEVFFISSNAGNLKEYKKKWCHVKNFKYVYTTLKSVSLKRNIGAILSDARTLAFADDDCIFTKQWLKRVRNHFQKSKEVLFGRTLPYRKTKFPGAVGTLGVFSQRKTTHKTKRRILEHAMFIGLSNNFAINKFDFIHLNGFSYLFGPGTVVKNGDDTDFIIRLLNKQYTTTYDEKMLLYHDKWLTESQARKQMQEYIRGGIVAYGFHMFNGLVECRIHVKYNILIVKKEIINNIIDFAVHPKNIIKDLSIIFGYIYNMVLGLIIAYIYYRYNRMIKKILEFSYYKYKSVELTG